MRKCRTSTRSNCRCRPLCLIPSGTLLGCTCAWGDGAVVTVGCRGSDHLGRLW
ncbi:hypothetical protein BDW68DRAFT_171947 [Aspergillus falconensis]